MNSDTKHIQVIISNVQHYVTYPENHFSSDGPTLQPHMNFTQIVHIYGKLYLSTERNGNNSQISNGQ